jgi:hypothetical protein
LYLCTATFSKERDENVLIKERIEAGFIAPVAMEEQILTASSLPSW